MVLVLLARNPTDSVTFGLLPAAARAGLRVRVLTDDAQAHRATYATARASGIDLPEIEVDECAVLDTRSVIAAVEDHPDDRPEAVLSNSDHLQTQTALLAAYVERPGKDWRSAIRARDKGLMRAALHRAEVDDTAFARLTSTGPLPDFGYPAVLKPAEGVASEDVVLVRDRADLERRLVGIRERRDGDLLLEGLLEGPLHTLETIGDGDRLRVWGGYSTTVSAEPYFIEERLTWDPAQPPDVVDAVLGQLAALGAGFGPCHTEFIVTARGPRIVEVNDRLIGDHCDFAMAEILGEPIFDDVIRVHLGEALGPRPEPAPRRYGQVHWVLATDDGVLTSAPAAISRTVQGAAGQVRLEYRPMRVPGSLVRVTGTNRDYLGSVQTIGADATDVDGVIDAFLRAERWVIE
jgi:biotin carboxylase